eukprot:9308486-Ditylum_brightwellii.AAC.1
MDNEQQTVTWHMDDVKCSHMDPKVNETFHVWCEQKYGSEGSSHVTVGGGKHCGCLVIIINS